MTQFLGTIRVIFMITTPKVTIILLHTSKIMQLFFLIYSQHLHFALKMRRKNLFIHCALLTVVRLKTYP